jgi:hypothetical protein
LELSIYLSVPRTEKGQIDLIFVALWLTKGEIFDESQFTLDSPLDEQIDLSEEIPD